MLKSGAWLLTPLLFLPLMAQETADPSLIPLLPDETYDAPPVDAITPVPLPEIPFGSDVLEQAQTLPANLKITTDGPISFTL